MPSERVTSSEVSPLDFRCTACGNCCRTLRVAVTALDVLRLTRATGQAATELVTWLAPDQVDMAGEPQSFVELGEGRRLLVLRQVDGACVLLGKDERCSAYAARPRDCRAFPFDFDSAPREGDAGVARRRLRLLPLQGCDFASDGRNDVRTLSAEDQARWQELRAYQALVARWNRGAWHRRRLRKNLGKAREFLEFALRDSDLQTPR